MKLPDRSAGDVGGVGAPRGGGYADPDPPPPRPGGGERAGRGSRPNEIESGEPEAPAGQPGRTKATWGPTFGRGFARLTVAPVVLVVSWLVTGLPLLLAGYFEPVPMLLIAAPLATAIAVNVLHRVPDRWPAVLPGPTRRRDWTAVWAFAGTLTVAVLFIAWEVAANSPSMIVTRSPGAYLQAGFWLAQHGSLPITQSPAAFGGQAGLYLSSTGFAQSGAAIVPTLLPGLPMLLAAGFWTSGVSGGSLAPPFLGGFAVLCFGGLVGRLAGRQWAPAGALILALSLPQMYVSRDAFAEPVIEILVFGGLSLLIDALTMGRIGEVARRRGLAIAAAARAVGGSQRRDTPHQALSDPGAPGGAGPTEGAGDGNPGRWGRGGRGGRGGWPARGHWREFAGWARDWATPSRLLGFMGGLSLGMSALASLSALVLVIPVIVVAAVLIAARRTGVVFTIGLVIGAACGLAAAVVLAPPLLSSLAPALEAAGAAGAALTAFTFGVVWLLMSPRVLALIRDRAARAPLRWLPRIAACAVIAALTGLAIRPYLQTVRAGPGFAQGPYIAALQAAQHLPIDPNRLYAEDTLYWVIWYAGISAVLLGGFGAAILVGRAMRALLSWRDATGADLNWAVPLAVVLGGSAAVLWQPYTIPDQPWASRRLATVVVPGLILFAIWAAAWLTGKARQRQAGKPTAVAVSLLLVVAIAYPLGVTSFGFASTKIGQGSGSPLSSQGLATHQARAGELSAVRGLCASIGASSSVLILDQHTADMYGQVIRGMCDVPVAWLPRSAPSVTVDAVLRGIASAGRKAVVLGATAGEVSAYGGHPRLVLDLLTTDDPHELTQPPGAPRPVRYMIWMTESVTSNIGV